jgi:hypothetical protein
VPELAGGEGGPGRCDADDEDCRSRAPDDGEDERTSHWATGKASVGHAASPSFLALNHPPVRAG